MLSNGHLGWRAASTACASPRESALFVEDSFEYPHIQFQRVVTFDAKR